MLTQAENELLTRESRFGAADGDDVRAAAPATVQ
jgi:hypothetical protein